MFSFCSASCFHCLFNVVLLDFLLIWDQDGIVLIYARASLFFTFRSCSAGGVLGDSLGPFGYLWAPFGSLLGSFSSLSFPFGSLLFPFGYLLLPFGCLGSLSAPLRLNLIRFGSAACEISLDKEPCVVIYHALDEIHILGHPILHNTRTLSEGTFTEGTSTLHSILYPLAQSGTLPYATSIRSGPRGARGVFD